MKIDALINKLIDAGIKLALEGDNQLRIRNADKKEHAALLNDIKNNKQDVIHWLKQQQTIPKATQTDRIPLTATQKSIWLICQDSERQQQYHLPLTLKISQALDSEILQQTLNILIQKHPALRLSFHEDNGDVYQSLSDNTCDITYFKEESLQTAKLWAQQNFNLEESPLFRVGIKPIDSNSFYFIFNIHHLICDGISNQILLKDFLSLYSTANNKQAPHQTTDAQADFVDYAYWIEQQNRLLDAQDDLQSIYQGTYAPDISYNASEKTSDHAIELDSQTPELIDAIVKELQVSEFSIYISIYAIAIYRYTGTEKFCICTPAANRNLPELENIVGLLANVLPIPFAFTEASSFKDIITQCHKTLINLQGHATLSIPKVAESVGVIDQRDLERFFSFSMLYEQFQASHTEAEAPDFEILESPQANQKFPFTLSVNQNTPSGIVFKSSIDTENNYKAEMLHQCITATFHCLSRYKDSKVSAFTLLSKPDQYRLLGFGKEKSSHAVIDNIYISQQTETLWKDHSPVHIQFENTAKKHPDNVAVIDTCMQLTYQQLNARANQLAGYLATAYEDHKFIAIQLPRSVDMAIAILAVLKSGKAYLPLEIDTPEERTQHILADSGCRIVLTHKESETTNGITYIGLNNPDIFTDENATFTSCNNHKSLFNLIYTSGSTGKPKGVLVNHQGIQNRINWMQQEYELSTIDRVLQKTPLTFDVSGWEIFWPLTTGASCVFLEEGKHTEPEVIADTIIENAVSVCHFVPSMLDHFVQTAKAPFCLSLRHVFCSGEALKSNTSNAFSQSLPYALLFNLYGPTEASIDVTHHTCSKKDGKNIPIGKPIANTHIYILDGALNPVCPGAMGEIYIAGLNLADGYHNLDLANQESFIKNPWFAHGSPYQRLYKTGDLGYYNAEGEIVFAGRNDRQLKINGVRIEPSEIENAALSHPHISQACCFKQTLNNSNIMALAFTADETINKQSLRSHLEARLNRSMQPHKLLQIEKIPLTSSGKTDVRKLTDNLLTNHVSRSEQVDDTSKQIIEVFESFFPGQTITEHADFFELGGNSITAAKLTKALSDKFDQQIHLAEIYQHTSITELSAFIKSNTLRNSAIPSNNLQLAKASIQQQRLYNLYKQQHNTAYHMPVQFILEGTPDIFALENAIKACVYKHSALRTVLRQTESGLLQEVLSPNTIKWPISISACPAEQLNTLSRSFHSTAYKLDKEIPLRTAIIKLDNASYAFLLNIHHIACDAFSLRIIWEDIYHFYHSKCDLSITHTSPEGCSYIDYTQWLDSLDAENDIAWWKHYLHDANYHNSLPRENLRHSPTETSAGLIKVPLGESLSEAIYKTSNKTGTTPFILCLTIYQLLIRQISQQKDFCIGVVTSGRNHPDLEQTVGCFVESYITRFNELANLPFTDLISKQKQQFSQILQHRFLPDDEIYADIASQHQAFDCSVAFNFINHIDAININKNWSDFTVISQDDYFNDPKYDLSWIVSEHHKSLAINIEYNPHYFTEAQIHTWAKAYTYALEQVTLKHDISINSLMYIAQDQWKSFVEPTNRQLSELIPSTSKQQDIFLDSLIRAEASHNIIGFSSYTRSEIDATTWKSVIETLYKENPYLRASLLASRNNLMPTVVNAFHQADSAAFSQHYQFIEHNDVFSTDFIDIYYSELQASLDYTVDNAWKAELHRFKDGTHFFILAAHHSLFDGASIQLLGQVIKNNYLSQINNQPTRSLTNNFPRYVLDRINGEDQDNTLKLWQAINARTLPQLDYAQYLGNKTRNVERRSSTLSESQSEQLKILARSHRTTPAIVFKSVFSVLIKLFHAIDTDLVLFETVANRDKTSLLSLGLFFDEEPNYIPGTLFQNKHSFSDLLVHFTQQKKQQRLLGTLSSSAKRRIFNGQTPYLFNFYTMETETEFMGQKEVITHHFPDMEDAVNLIIRTSKSRFQVDLTYPASHLDGNAFMHTLMFIIDRLAEGKRLFHELIPSQAIRKFEATEIKHLPDTLLQELEGNPLTLVTSFGNSPADGIPGQLFIKQKTKEQIETRHIVLTQGADYFYIKRVERLKNVTQRAIRKDTNGQNIESLLISSFSHVFSNSAIQAEDNFFELGGTSIHAAKLAYLLQAEYGFTLSLAVIYHYPTIRTLALHLLETSSQHLSAELPEMAANKTTDPYPLSFAQKRLWLLMQLNEEHEAYNISSCVKLSEKININHLVDAYNIISSRHQALRSKITLIDDKAHINVLPADQCLFSRDQIKHVPAINDECLQQLCSEASSHRFNLKEDRLSHFNVLSDGSSHALSFTIHHLVADAQSLQILIEDLAKEYLALEQGARRTHPEPILEYSDYACWQAQLHETACFDPSLDFWKKYLHKAPYLIGLPVKGNRSNNSFAADRISITLPESLHQQLITQSQNHAQSPFILALASFYWLLSSICQQDDLCVALPRDGRIDPRLNRVIGFFVNAIICRVKMDQNLSIKELLEATSTAFFAAVEHEHVPGELLMQKLDLPRELNYIPYAQAAFNWVTLNDNAFPSELADLITPLTVHNKTAKFELLFSLVHLKDSTFIEAEFNSSLFNRKQIQTFLIEYSQLLTTICFSKDIDNFFIQSHRYNSLQKDNYYPLTPVQRDLYLASISNPETLENSIGYALELPLSINTALWEKSLKALHDHFPALSMSLAPTSESSGLPLLQISEAPPELHILDWSATHNAKTNAEMEAAFKQLVAIPYDLDNQPLIKHYLIKVNDQRWYTVLACHHLLLDGQSFTHHAYHLVSNYFCLVEGSSHQFPNDNFPAFIEESYKLFDQKNSIAFWQDKLKSTDALHQEQVSQEADNSSVSVLNQPVEQTHYESILDYCKRNRITPALYFKAIYALLIHLYCYSKDDFIFSEYHHGRNRKTLNSMGCFFHQQFVFIADSGFKGTFSNFLSTLKQEEKASKRHQLLSPSMQNTLKGSSGLNFSFNYFYMPKSGERNGVNFDGFSYSPDFEDNIDFRVQVDKGALTIGLCHKPCHFTENHFLDRVLHLSQQILSNNDIRMDELSIILDHEIQQTDEAASNNNSIITDYNDVVSQHASNIAAFSGEKSFSYRELEQLKHAIEEHLCATNTASPVAVLLPLSTELSAALMATISSGAYYLPIDINLPIEQIRYRLDNSDVRIIITNDEGIKRCGDLLHERTVVDTGQLDLAKEQHSDHLPLIQSNDLLYTMYSSGTTGVATASYIYQRSFNNLLDWYTHTINITANDRCLITSSPGFDLTQKNIFACLTTGASMVYPDKRHYDPAYLLGLIEEHHVTFINMTPSAFIPLCNLAEESDFKAFRYLRFVILGGEPFELQSLSQWINHASFNTTLINSYGPTECTDVTHAKILSPTEAIEAIKYKESPLSIGTVIPNILCDIVGPEKQALPQGFTGEIRLSGICVAASSKNLQQNKDSATFYTRDLASKTPSNEYIYRGRLDDQQKINGKRISLNLIEHYLSCEDDITECKVLADGNNLKAYIKLSPLAGNSSPNTWKQSLQQNLDTDFIPNQFYLIDAWPLTPHGKIDSKALIREFNTAIETEMRAPVTQTEKNLFALWAGILGHNNFGIDDNFFLVGGDSLTSLELLKQLNTQFKQQIAIDQLFNAQTIEDQADLILSGKSNSAVICFNSEGKDTPLVFIHNVGGLALPFIPLAHRLKRDIPVYALQANTNIEYSPLYEEQLFSLYLQELAKHTNNRIFNLATHSLGGLLAIRFAKYASVNGYTINTLILLDSYLPTKIQTSSLGQKQIARMFAEQNLGMNLPALPLSSFENWKADLMQLSNGLLHENDINNSMQITTNLLSLVSKIDYEAFHLGELAIHLIKAEKASSGSERLAKYFAKAMIKTHDRGWGKFTNNTVIHTVNESHESILQSQKTAELMTSIIQQQ